MNEILFLLQILVLALASLVATRFGYYALVAMCSSQVLLCNLFVSKQINLFSLSVSSSDAYTITLFLLNNIGLEIINFFIAKFTSANQFSVLMIFTGL